MARSDAVAIASPLTTAVISDDAGFQRLEPEWDRLLEDSDQQVYFLRWHWNWSWWQRLAPPGSRLHVVCCRDAAGRLVGVAPLYEAPRRLFGVSWLRDLAMLGTGIELKTAEYMDVFVCRGAEADVGEALARALRASPSWDRATFIRVPDDSTVMHVVLGASGGAVTSQAFDSAPFIDTRGSWDDYKQSLGRSMRRNSEYYARRMARTHDLRFSLAESQAEFEAGFDHLVRLHQARWQAVDEPGTFSSEVVLDFFREVMRRSHAEGRLRLWTLAVDDKVEAALVGFADNGICHYFQKGFNPHYVKDGLGTVILSLALRACFEDKGIRTFDFMGGGAEYKTLWARQERATVLHEVSRSTAAARTYGWYLSSREAAANFYRRVAPTPLRAFRRAWLRRKQRDAGGALLNALAGLTMLSEFVVDVAATVFSTLP